jgi:UDP-sulfoquinovose synthase
MNKTVLVIGYDGYIGHALTLRLLKQGYKVIGIDDCSRRYTVSEMNSYSVIPILSMKHRSNSFKEYGNFEHFRMNFNHDYLQFGNIVKKYKPNTIVNLAQQPSAPYSHISRNHTLITVNNNINGTLNCLYVIKENNPDIQLIQIGSMGEYDQSMGVDIEEGVFNFEHNDKIAENVIYPRRAPSFYHGSKIASTYFIDLAVRSWGLNVTDIMQGIVYGNSTLEIFETGLDTRLDIDECFGTVLNRFIVQTIIGHPLTIYGEGEQQRGFLALNDSIQCLMLAIENPADGYRTWNQFAEPYSIMDLTRILEDIFEYYHIRVKVQHIDSPRTENTSRCYFNAKTTKLEDIGFEPTTNIENEIRYIINKMKNVDLSDLYDVVLPKIRW